MRFASWALAAALVFTACGPVDETEADQLVRHPTASPQGALPHEVEYVMTVRGPQPLTHRTDVLDYAHYLEKQLAPALDVVLTQLGTSWQRLAGNQLELFS